MLNLIVKFLLILIIVVLMIFLVSKFTGSELNFNEYLPVINVSDDSQGDDIDDDEEGDDLPDERIHIVDGFKAVEIDEEIQEISGVRYEQQSEISITPEFVAYAEVIDVAPLVKLKTDFRDLLAERKVLQNKYYNYNKQLTRAEALHESRSLSTIELEKKRAERDLAAEELDAKNTRIENFIYETTSNWGGEISKLIFEPDLQPKFGKLASHENALVQVSLLKDQVLENTSQKVFISTSNDRQSAHEVSYLDRAIRINNPLYVESHIYLSESGMVTHGSRLFAWIEESSKHEQGIFIPDEAVIWYANEPWFYIKQGNLFVRKPLGKARKIRDGWLTRSGISTNDLVVISGGQTLLSEEFKWAIPDEEDD